MDVFLERMASTIAPSSQSQLHDILKAENGETFGFDFFVPTKMTEQVVRGKSNESSASGYNPENGVKLASSPSDDGWLKA